MIMSTQWRMSISIGLDKMLRDAIPEDQEWNTLMAASGVEYDKMCDLVADIWKRGKEIGEEERQSVKGKMSSYIR